MTDWEAYNNWAYLQGPKRRSQNMILTKEQKAAVAKIIHCAAARARQEQIDSEHDMDRRAFYEQLEAEANALLPIFRGREKIEVEEDEEEDEAE